MWSRFSKKDKYKGKIIVIDHHPKNEESFDLEFISTNFTSASEIIYHLFFSKDIDKATAETLLMGIIGDTGKFSFVNHNKAGVFGVVEKLVRAGSIDIQLLESRYSKVDLDALFLLGKLIENIKIHKIEGWPGFLTSYLSSADRQRFGQPMIKEASMMFKHYIRSVKESNWGFIVIPDFDGSGVSFRSLPGVVDVNFFSNKALGGGGHVNAAGGFMEAEPEYVVDFLVRFVSSNKYQVFRQNI